MRAPILPKFQRQVSENRIGGSNDYLCVALTVFASWRPGKALAGALLFGAFDAFQLRLQHQIGGAV